MTGGTQPRVPKTHVMGRRLVLLLSVVALGLGLAAIAGAADYSTQKQQVDAKLEELKGRIAEIRRREEGIRSELVVVNGRISALESKVGAVTGQLDQLNRDLDLRKRRLDTLRELYQLETVRLGQLRVQFATAKRNLDRRLVDLYQQEDPTAIDVVLNSASIQDVLDNLEFVEKIGQQDRRIVKEVAAARDSMTRARARTKEAAAGVQAEARVIAARASQVAVVRNQLLEQRGRLTAARDDKRQSLDTLTAEEREEAEEMDALVATSARLADQIRAAQEAARRAAEERARLAQQQAQQSGQAAPVQAAPSAAPGALIWPAQGPVTSPYGPRWGRMHEGIDIGAPLGAPIVASAAGTVIVSASLDGYGNTIVIDHGGGIATLYGHASSLLVGVGAVVSRGQQIATIGNTGRSTGPHLHFEVRVNGSAVDPLGYL
jgi:murein DD-endopeptidase MepM/ murein hydrolase activator NlpD